MMKRKVITQAIWLISLVSLLTDLASEMLYPILPVYLQKVGFSIALIGVLEGVAEATAGLSKGYFGRLSDEWGKRLPFVRLGYTLGALSKPLLALSALPGWVFAVRTLERLGKGLRTAPRDALLADQSDRQSRGQVFGFHRSMDRLGGVLGPILALVYLYFFPGQYVTLFVLAFVPGLLSVALTFLLKEPELQPNSLVPAVAGQTAPTQNPSVFGFLRYWTESQPEYRRVVGGLLAFALFNSSDVFLLLKAKEAGLSDTTVVSLYIVYNLTYAVMAYPVGRLADRLGLRPTLLVGMGLFALVYEGMATASKLPLFAGLLGLYGLYAAATEGVAKAWISTICGPRQTATAIGTYVGLSSLCALVANSFAGWLWYQYGSSVTFAVTGAGTLAVIVYLVAIEARSGEVVPKKLRPASAGDGDVAAVSDRFADDELAEARPTVVLSRSAFWAILLLIAGLGVWTVYMSFLSLAGRANVTNAASPAAASASKAVRRTGPDRPSTRRTSREPAFASAIEAPRSQPVDLPAALKPAPAPNAPAKLRLVTRRPTRVGRARLRRSGVYAITSVYTRVYDQPDKRSRRRVLVNLGKKPVVSPLAERNGFFYVTYTVKKGNRVSGWLPKDKLRLVGRR